MKKKSLIVFVLCVALLCQSCGCSADSDDDERRRDKETTNVSGPTVFRALKNQVKFDSTLNEVINSEDLFEDLPAGSEVTLYTGPETYSDQLGMVEVESESDLDDAEESVNKYLQDMYNSAYAEDPNTAEKFENVAIWKHEVYIVFCITIHYELAMQVIENTVDGEENTTPVVPDNDPPKPPIQNETENRKKWDYYGPYGHRTIEIEGNHLTFSNADYEGDYYSAYCNIIKDGNYTYYYVDEETALVVINEEILGMLNTHTWEDEESLKTPIDAEYDQYIESWYFKEGSEDSLPANLDMDSVDALIEEIYIDEVYNYSFVYRYYAESKLLNVSFEDHGGITFYVENDGSVTYVEGISLVHQTQYPGAIWTGANYVIVDTM